MDELPRLPLDDLAPFLERALAEDRAAEDVTARAIVPADRAAVADVIARGSGSLAGLPLAAPLFRLVDPDVALTFHQEDGEEVAAGSPVLTAEGRARSLLAAERTLLNVLGRMGGIATLTRAFVEAAMGTRARILDTRKTAPGWRVLDKYAVLCGGGHNHRMDLSDAAMIKENHLYAAFGTTGPEAIREAVARCREALPDGVDLFVEVENQAELEAAAEAGATRIMLDGFDLGTIRAAVRWVRAMPPPRPLLEVTGGVTLTNVGAYAATGVDRISIGALTHSAPVLDLAMKIRPHP